MSENRNNLGANLSDPGQGTFNRGIGSQNDDLQQDIANGDQKESNLMEIQDDSDYDEDLDVRYPRNQKKPANPGNQEEGSPSGRSGSSSPDKVNKKITR